ncbi:hypothetical protein NECAME_15056 [Necator americanus]|uniref:Uncharacterized protein n=1 Tax=Necator americanus TaxID=51031 RepID=W2SJM8_NECAM|nr:hypothetical protein NECAME_15056 [Necator americanus]ETN69844.1 hypothetical protein NECAME_15056 [Necator americanus]
MTSPSDGSPTPYSNSLQPTSTIPPDSETTSTPSSSTAITKLAGAKPIIPSFPSTSTTHDNAGSNEEDVDDRRLATITTTTTTGVNTVTMTTTTTMTNSGNNNQNVNSNMNNVQIVNNNMNNANVVNVMNG